MSFTARAGRRGTSAWLTIGAAASAVFFVVALLAEQLGAESTLLIATDVAGVITRLPAFDPSAWAMTGVYLVLITPVVGIAITAWEYAGVHDRRTVVLAIAVLVSLGVSLIAAILR